MSCDGGVPPTTLLAGVACSAASAPSALLRSDKEDSAGKTGMRSGTRP